jgi:hypothetical protein
MQAPSHSLEDIQRKFAEALLDVHLAGQTLPMFKCDASQLEGRLGFYRGNLTAIWTQALANAYPVLCQLVGTDFFEQLARAYGQAFPSQSGDLNHFGANFPTYLAQLPIAVEYPYFPDVAALEWQVHRSYYAADATTLSLPDLLASAANDLPTVHLNWHPAAQLHQSSYASVKVWLAHQADETDQTGQTGQKRQIEQASFNLTEPDYALISREQWRVAVLPLEPAAYQALQALSRGSSIGQALELAVESNSDFEIANQLNLWFSAGAFSSAV